VEDNNTARAYYSQYTVQQRGNLGPQHLRQRGGGVFGWSFEACGFVYPSDFNYPGAELHLDRDAHWAWYEGMQQQPPWETNFNANIPPGNDTTQQVRLRDETSHPSPGTCNKGGGPRRP
jgi:hypothetical protein